MQLLCYPMTSILSISPVFKICVKSICYRFLQLFFCIRGNPSEEKMLNYFNIDLESIVSRRESFICKLNGIPHNIHLNSKWYIRKTRTIKTINFLLGTLFKYYEFKTCKCGKKLNQAHFIYDWPLKVLWRRNVMRILNCPDINSFEHAIHSCTFRKHDVHEDWILDKMIGNFLNNAKLIFTKFKKYI